MKLIPYLHFDGQCREAFDFYARVLGGTIGITMTYGQAPIPTHVAEEAKDRIMHMVLHAREITLMGSDRQPGKTETASGFHLSLHPTDPAEAERLYGALADGGAVHMPLQETFWAHKFGMVADRFGTPWMVSCDKTG